MTNPLEGDDDRRILLDALVSYADACVVPQLTPSCPFYVLSPDGPVCQEQCRALQHRLGGPERPVRQIAVGGLLMTGRVLPAESAAGAQPYDAGQRFVEERTLPPRDQSTATLLLGLRAALRVPVLGDPAAQAAGAMALWAELERRDVPVESVVRGALLKDMAFAIAVRAAAPYFADAGVIPSDSSAELRSMLADSALDGWSAVLRGAAATWKTPQDLAAAIAAEPVMSLPELDVPPWEDFDGPSPQAVDRAAATVEIRLAFSGLFLRRVEEWLSRLIEDDLQGLLHAVPPPASVLLALPVPAAPVRDEIGLWTWDRFARSRLEEWALPSLLLEWRCARGDTPAGACPPRVLAERPVAAEHVADLALDRQSRRRGRRAPARGLTAAALTKSAVDHLRAGRWQAAADVFAGLVALRPADGEAWNNLGFCQLPLDRAAALRSLQQASLYERDDPAVNAANRTLALHLVGRDDEALHVADAALTVPGRSTPSILWRHHGPDAPLVLDEAVDPAQYLSELRHHVAAGGCRMTA